MRNGYRLVALACALVALAACVPQAQAPPPDQPALAWPPAPDPARVAFVRAFSRPEDLGIAKGVLERLADLVFGASESRLVRPMAVVTVGALVYVADPGVRGVHRFDLAGG